MDQRTKVARFLPPITIEKQGPDQSYSRILVSFQSTGATNISCVNVLNGVSLYSKVKTRGKGNKKRSWVIEMNEARQFYLGSYGQIDTIDAAIKKCNIFYVTWKYWHAAKNHALALSIVMAYDIYKELATEKRTADYFKIKPGSFPLLTFHQFRDKLTKQALQYSPSECKYPGDAAMRVNTK